MTDKVQKIREEVERLFNHVKDSTFESDSGAFYYFKDLLDFIDSLQEEPKFSVGDKIRRKDDHDMTIEIKELKDGCYVEGGEFYVRFSEQDDWELVEEPSIPDIVDKHWWEMLGEEPILEVLAKYLDHVSREEAMKTKGAIDRWFAEYYPKPVSDELKDAADKYSQSIHSDYSNDMFDSRNIYDAVIYGANWQKQRDEDEIRMIRELLDNFDKTCDEYHDAGFKHGQEALMKDAVECKICVSYENPYGGFTQLVDSKEPLVTFGKEVKLIIIKDK